MAGNSHIVCFGLYHAADGQVKLVELQKNPPVFGIQAPWPRPSDYLERAFALAAGGRLVLSHSGWSQLLFSTDTPFDFVSSAFPSLPLESGARILPESLVRMHNNLRHWPAAMADAILRLKKLGAEDLVVLCQPPPKKDNDVIRARLKNEPVLVQRAESAGLSLETAPITPPFIRLKFWGMINQMNRQEAISAGVKYIEVPQESQDDYGFLKEEYWSQDVTHANSLYGELYLAHILSTLAKDKQ